MFTERGQGLIKWGAVLLALSALTGFAIPLVSDPVLGLATHVQGLLNAFLLLLVGLIWSRLEIGYLGAVVTYWGLIVGAYLTLAVQFAATLLRIGGTVFPIAGGSHVGTPLEEELVKRSIQFAAAVTTVALLLVARAALRKPSV